jgi:hypothetical protein
MYPIATYTVTSAGTINNFNFTSIPSTFTHLQVRMFGRSDYSGATFPFFIASNANGGTDWWHSLIGNGSSVSSSNYSQGGMYTLDAPAATSTSNTYGAVIVDILDYANTNKNKVFRSIAGYDANGSGYARFNSYLEGLTTTITNLNISTVGTGYFTVGSTFQLYGISTSNATGA